MVLSLGFLESSDEFVLLVQFWWLDKPVQLKDLVFMDSKFCLRNLGSNEFEVYHFWFEPTLVHFVPLVI